MAAEQYSYLIKLLLIGDVEVGKSSVMLRYTADSFTSNYVETIGVEFRTKLASIDEKTVKLQVWDTAGHDRFRAITEAYYRGSAGVMIVYDVTNQRSLDSIEDRLRGLKEHAPSTAQVMMLGNKCDVNNDTRMVSTDRGKLLAEEYGVMFMEVSAKTGENIDNALTTLVQSVMLNLPQSNQDCSVR